MNFERMPVIKKPEKTQEKPENHEGEEEVSKEKLELEEEKKRLDEEKDKLPKDEFYMVEELTRALSLYDQREKSEEKEPEKGKTADSKKHYENVLKEAGANLVDNVKMRLKEKLKYDSRFNYLYDLAKKIQVNEEKSKPETEYQNYPRPEWLKS